MRLVWVGVVRVGVVLVGGCSDAYTGPVVTATGITREYRHVGYHPFAPGVTVCVYEQPSLDCATSDAMGRFTLQVPVGETALLYSADTFVTSVIPVTPVADFVADIDLLPHNDLLLLAGLAGVSIQPGKGLITFDVMGNIGITAMQNPHSGVGPVYNGMDGVPDPTLIATTYEGRGEYANVDPGDYEITFQRLNTTFSLQPPYGWASDGGSRVPVIADGLTGFTISVK